MTVLALEWGRVLLFPAAVCWGAVIVAVTGRLERRDRRAEARRRAREAERFTSPPRPR